jgi:mannose-6-phosphate isomerase-like protein (cupin superfamily)
MNIAMTIVAALAVAVPSATLTGDKTQVIPAHDLQAQLAQLAPLAKTKGSSGSTLATSGNLALKLSVRTTSGGAEIHAYCDDLMIVQQGSATLITGGTVADAQTGKDGETKGTSVKDGKSQNITVGDVVLVPAGTPHQLLIPPGTLYSALVAKVKEP